ncbi:unnamed protein product [Choristocarpus tenellus]
MTLKMILVVLIVACAAAVSAFRVSMPTGIATVRPVRAPTALADSYVPDGLTAKEWAAIKDKEVKNKAKNKAYYAKKKSEPLADWLKKIDKGAGHTFAKVKEIPKAKPGASRFL